MSPILLLDLGLIAIAPADAHALTMVGILAFALGSLVTMFIVMAHNGRKNEELDLPEFPKELDSSPSPKKPTTPRSQPDETKTDWQKDADWWK